MPSPSPHSSHSASCHAGAKTVSLNVLTSAAASAPKVKKSRASFWRVVSLLVVHVLMGAHLLHWWASGRDDGVRETLAPIEPSEAMFLVKDGNLTLGAIFLGSAVVSTLLLGRWFCGWGCHIVALQDLCAWMMKKIGIHPKPFRTRLVLWGTLVMAFYMFLWPALHRWVLTPWLGESLPHYFGRSAPWPGLETHLHVEDLWSTFAAVPVAIPFLFVCGFVVVYFLGAKGYCTYGCPYGALFAPADTFAPARIVVNDNCEQCGHCTAVCTSNVRVHEEVRDFGAVVDPGCMKCLDCVSVCPNHALSFGLSRPALLAKPRDLDAAARREEHPRGSPRYDLSLGTELLLFAIWIAVLWGIRGTLDWVPLLFASGLAALATFGVAKTWSMFREPNVRAQNLQLKLKGRMRPMGVLLALVTLGLLGASVWSGYVRMYLRDTAAVDHYHMMRAITANGKNMLDPSYTPTDEITRLATSVRAKLTRSDSPSRGGIGWTISPADLARLSQAQFALKDTKAGEASYIELLIRESPQNMQIASELLQIMMARGASLDEINKTLDRVIAEHPKPGAVMLSKAYLVAMEAAELGQRGEAPASAAKFEESRVWIRKALSDGVATDVRILAEANRMLHLSGARDEAAKGWDAAIAARPRVAYLPLARARTLLETQEFAAAEAVLREALVKHPKDDAIVGLLSQLLESKGAAAESATLRATLNQPPEGEGAMKAVLAVFTLIIAIPPIIAIVGGLRRLMPKRKLAMI